MVAASLASLVVSADAPLGRAAAHFFEDFDAPMPARRPAPRSPHAAEPPAPPPAPSFTADDLGRVRDEAYAEGLADGQAAALCAAEADAAARLDAFAQALQAAREEAAARIEEAARGLARLLLAVLAALFPRLCEHFGPAEAASVCRTLLPALKGESDLVLRAAPATLEAIRAALATDAGAGAGPAGRVSPESWVADPALAAGDLRLHWREGEAVRDGAGLLGAVLAVLAEAGLAEPGAEPGADPGPDGKPATGAHTRDCATIAADQLP